MIEQVPLFSILTESEIQLLETLLGGSQALALNGRRAELEQGILAKTRTKSLEMERETRLNLEINSTRIFYALLQ